MSSQTQTKLAVVESEALNMASKCEVVNNACFDGEAVRLG